MAPSSSLPLHIYPPVIASELWRNQKKKFPHFTLFFPNSLNWNCKYTDSVEPAAAPMAASPFPAESRHKKPDIDQFAPEKATKNSAAAVEKGHNGGMRSRNVGKAADWRPKAEWKLVEGQYGLSISWKWMQKWRMSVAFLIVQLLEMHYGSVMRKSDYEGGMMLQILTIAETGYGISIGKHEQNLL
ncbi:hypothetical protein LXL04_022602 [Taraxacum kok-saghyz]